MKKSMILLGMLSIGYAYAQTENYEAKVGINTETPSATLNVKSKVGNTTEDTKNFELHNGAGTQLVTVLDNGRAGFGTPTPLDKVHVRGGSIRIEGRGNVGQSLAIINTDKPEGTDNVMSMWRIYNMTGAYGNSLQFWGYKNTTGAGLGAVESILVLADTGDIGISTKTPTQRLDVNGNARLRTLPNVEGADTDKVVVVDNTGVLKTVARSSFTISSDPTTATNGVQNTTDMACNDANRGKMNFVKDVTIGSGTGDAFAVCLKGTDGNHYWRYLYGASGVTTSTENFGTGLQ